MPTAPSTFAMMTAVLAVAALIASLLPAVRAARVGLLHALRNQQT